MAGEFSQSSSSSSYKAVFAMTPNVLELRSTVVDSLAAPCRYGYNSGSELIDNTTGVQQSDTRTAGQKLEWLFAILHKHRTYLYMLRINPTQTGATIMQLLRKEYNGYVPNKPWFRTQIIIEDATISPLCIGDFEAQDYPREVIVNSSTPLADLTEAFKNPSVLRGRAFVSMNNRYIVATGSGIVNRPCHAILIKTATCKTTVAVILAMVVLFSVIVGLVFGFWTRDAKIGLAVCAGAIGIFALIQASMVGLDSVRSDSSR